MGSGWRGGSPICPVCPAPSRVGLATPPSGPVSTRIILGAPELRLPLEQSRACWPWTPLQGQASLGVPVRPQGHWWFTCPECSRCCCLGELTLPPAWVPGGAEPLSSGALGWGRGGQQEENRLLAERGSRELALECGCHGNPLCSSGWESECLEVGDTTSRILGP